MVKKYSTLIRRNARRSVIKRSRQRGRVYIEQILALALKYPGDFPVAEEQIVQDDSRVESQH